MWPHPMAGSQRKGTSSLRQCTSPRHSTPGCRLPARGFEVDAASGATGESEANLVGCAPPSRPLLRLGRTPGAILRINCAASSVLETDGLLPTYLSTSQVSDVDADGISLSPGRESVLALMAKKAKQSLFCVSSCHRASLAVPLKKEANVWSIGSDNPSPLLRHKTGIMRGVRHPCPAGSCRQGPACA